MIRMDEFATAYANRFGVSKREAKNIISNFCNLITDSLVDGEDVQLTGFFTFKTKQRAAERKSPRTGEMITIPERRVALVKIGTKVKNALNAD